VDVKLHASTIGRGPHVVLLHGLFGSGNNLGALARALSDRFTVHSLDLPNHGRSAWVAQADLASMASSLAGWLGHHGIGPARLVGHSLGGKVAMQLALDHPERVGSLVVADIAPVAYPPHHDAVFAALEAVANGGCGSRQEAAALMAEHLRETGVIQFLLASLQRGAGGVYRWRFNLEGIRAGYRAVRDAPVHARPYPGAVLFVKGGESDYIRPEHRSHILALFPAAQVKIMPGCGHWLHAERPSLFNSIVGRFLDAQPG
jgi:esterase